MKKRIISTVLAATMLAMCLTGCGGESGGGDSQEGQPTEVSPEEAVGKQKVTFEMQNRYYNTTQPDEVVKNPVMDEINKLRKEKLGYEVEQRNLWAPSADYGSKLQTLFAGGALPDMVYFAAAMPIADINKYGEAGMLVDLTQYKDIMPDLFAMLDESPLSQEQCYSPEGKLFVIPEVAVYPDGKCDSMGGAALRKDILDKHNLEIPETLDEWFDVAMALRQEYPDVYPIMTFEDWERLETGIFEAYHVVDGVYYNGSEFVYGPFEDGWKEALQYLHKLYENQLIAPDYNVSVGEKSIALLANGQAFMLPQNWDGYVAQWNAEYPDQEWVWIPGLKKDENSEPWIGYVSDDERVTLFNTYSWGVSAESEHIEDILKIYNMEFTKEVLDLRAYGIEGVSYEVGEDGEYDLIGEYADPAVGNDRLMELGANTPSNKRVEMCELKPRITIYSDGALQENVSVYEFLREAENEKKLAPYLYKSVILSTDENEEYANVMTAVETYVSEQKAKFISGERSFDEWDVFIGEVNAMGDIQAALDIRNAKLN